MSHNDHICEDDILDEEIIDEMYYKEFLQKAKLNILPHRDYSHLIKYVKFQKIKGNTMEFLVPGKFNAWMCFVRFDEWNEQVHDLNITAVEAARLLLWGGNVRFHCGCPSYCYHGYQYILTQTDSAIVPEVRFPHIRNPYLHGIMCKHGRRVFMVLGMHVGDMARAIKQQRQALGI